MKDECAGRASIRLRIHCRYEDLLTAGGTEAASTAQGVCEVGFFPADRFVAGYDHLGDSVAGMDLEGLFAEVVEDHFDLAAVAGIDGGRTVGQGDAELEGESAAGTDLGFETWGQFDGNTRGDEFGFGRTQGDVLYSVQVHTGVFFGTVGAAGDPGSGVEAIYADSEGQRLS